MQMTNYKAYLKGNLSRTGLSRQELKLKVARLNFDPKKIVDTLSQILGVEGVKTWISSQGRRDFWQHEAEVGPLTRLQ
jgi:hypothetical protein